MTSVARRRWLLAALTAGLVGGCRREVAPPPDAASPASTESASIAPHTPVAVASVATPSPTPTLGELESWDVVIAGKRWTLILPRAGASAWLVDPAMGEWSAMMVLRDADSVTVSDEPGVVTLTRATGASEASATVGAAPAVRVPFKPHVNEPTPIAPTVVPTLEGDATNPQVLGRHGAVVVAWSSRLLPAFPSLSAPKRWSSGGATVTPEPIAATRVAGCVVRGVRASAATPALDEALRTAFESETRAVCQTHGGRAILEASYSLVPFSGVNRIDGSRAPAASDVIGMTLVHRVTRDEGSVIVETGYLVGLAKPEVVSLRSVLAPGGAAWLTREARAIADLPKGLPPPVVIDASRGAIVAGPSTIDVVIDPLPYGLFLRTRRIGIGPRSATVAAFVPGPLTQRMLAMMNVDY